VKIEARRQSRGLRLSLHYSQGKTWQLFHRNKNKYSFYYLLERMDISAQNIKIGWD
jgi:hypothetical protein